MSKDECSLLHLFLYYIKVPVLEESGIAREAQERRMHSRMTVVDAAIPRPSNKLIAALLLVTLLALGVSRCEENDHGDGGAGPGGWNGQFTIVN